MKHFRPQLRLLATALLAAAIGAQLTGCKGDPAPSNRPVADAPKPVLHAPVATTLLLNADPFTDPNWQRANWIDLSPALKDTRTPPRTKVASFYGPKCLYVAFLCVHPNTNPQTGMSQSLGTPINPKLLINDQTEVWLDTSAAQNGTEIVAVTVDQKGMVSSDWYRASSPPEPMEDGTPNKLYPISQIPNYLVPGLEARISTGTMDGLPAWGMVVAIPFQGLPKPLRVDAAQIKPGTHWRVNLLRSNILKKDGHGQDILQANLSPIFVGSQKNTPYLMTQLVLDNVVGTAGAVSSLSPAGATGPMVLTPSVGNSGN